MDDQTHNEICERYTILLDPGILRNSHTERVQTALEDARIAVEQSFAMRAGELGKHFQKEVM